MKAIKKVVEIISLIVGIILFGHPTTTLGASVNVLVGSGGLVFVPATTNISVNDSVIWSWAGNFHSSTSGSPPGTPDHLWDSGVSNAPNSFTHTFTSAGTFPYFCRVHFSFGMVGSIIVSNSVVPPPVVTITNPASGTVLSAPASLTLAASASVASGSITNVEFFQGATSLGNVATPPYSVTVSDLPAADYTFSAVATADSGLSATNSISVSVITPSPLIISSPSRSQVGQFQFTYSSDAGLTYVVQVSANLLSNWTSIATNTATANSTGFTDPNATSATSFYRVLRLPNP